LERDLPKKTADAIIRQLIFREFYFQIIDHFPNLLEKNAAFDKKWENFVEDYEDKYWKAWIEGKTGIPIIDAGMRQMLATGFMHNRVRMLSASVLFKDMGIDWRKGEKFFAQHLYDYDPSQNNQGWQSTCGMGASALPYFRVMNPWTQQEKFDPTCEYIKEWIPELRDLSAAQIHKWNEKQVKGCDYPEPVLNHSERAKIFLARVKKML
jgi:deoxyribodipyrimidine photo-lyase